MTDLASQNQVLTLWLFLYPWIIPVYGFLGIKIKSNDQPSKTNQKKSTVVTRERVDGVRNNVTRWLLEALL
jgi:hypothetical protein